MGLAPGGQDVLERLGRLEALPGDYVGILNRYVGHVLVEGMLQAQADVDWLKARLRKRGVQLAKREAEVLRPSPRRRPATCRGPSG